MIGRAKRSRAFILFEMMFVLSLLAVFGLVAVKLMVLSLNVPKQAAERHNRVLRFDSLVTRLREDAWAARSMSTPDDRTLKLEFNDGPAVTWKVSDEKVERTADDSKTSQRWELDEKVTFNVQPPVISLNVKEMAGEQGTLRIVSQRMMLEEAHR